MRRWRAMAGTAALVCAMLAGCRSDAGTQSSVTAASSPPAPPTSFTPQAGTCHPTFKSTSDLGGYAPVDCAKAHRLETVHVGTFTGAPADQPAPPQQGSPAMRSAFADCDARAKRFVGADWRGGRLSIQVVTPSPAGWTGGNRWYRCDLFETAQIDGVTLAGADPAIQRTGTLRDALAKPGPLAHTCFSQDSLEYLQPVPCGKPHHFEYAGTWTSPDMAYASLKLDGDSAHRRCRSVIAGFVKVPVSADLRIGTALRPPAEDAWARGDRGIRCYLESENRPLTRSLKGAGPRALP